MTILGERNFTVTRFAACTVVDFKPVPGASSTLTIRASVQPLKGEELEQLPEGERSKDTRKLYTTTRLYTARETTGQIADEITIDGEQFVVVGVKVYDQGVLDHYKVLATRKNRT